MGSGAGSRSWSSWRTPDAALGGLFIRSFFCVFLSSFFLYFKRIPSLLLCSSAPSCVQSPRPPPLAPVVTYGFCPTVTSFPPFPRCYCWSADHPIIILLFSSRPLLFSSLLFALRPLSRLSLFPIMLPSRAPAARRLTPSPLCPCPCPRPLSSPLSQFPLPHHDPPLYTYLPRAQFPIAAGLAAGLAPCSAIFYCNLLRGGSGGSVDDAAMGEPRRVHAAP